MGRRAFAALTCVAATAGALVVASPADAVQKGRREVVVTDLPTRCTSTSVSGTTVSTGTLDLGLNFADSYVPTLKSRVAVTLATGSGAEQPTAVATFKLGGPTTKTAVTTKHKLGSPTWRLFAITPTNAGGNITISIASIDWSTLTVPVVKTHCDVMNILTKQPQAQLVASIPHG